MDNPPAAPAPDRARETKQALVVVLLQRKQGASLAELVAATSWLPHTTRAALTRLRQGGHEIMAVTDSQTAAVENEVAHLRGLDLDALRARWRSQTGRAAPAHLPKGLLLRVLAYRAQAAVFGDLDKATTRLLDRIADDAGSGKRVEVPVPDRVGIRAGTLLVREWEGVSHRVMVMAEGFAWNGSTYPSLSKVARAITSTRWNGPRFFGLRDQNGSGR